MKPNPRNYYVSGANGWHSDWTTFDNAHVIARKHVKEWADVGMIATATVFFSNGSVIARISDHNPNIGVPPEHELQAVLERMENKNTNT